MRERRDMQVVVNADKNQYTCEVQRQDEQVSDIPHRYRKFSGYTHSSPTRLGFSSRSHHNFPPLGPGWNSSIVTPLEHASSSRSRCRTNRTGSLSQKRAGEGDQKHQPFHSATEKGLPAPNIYGLVARLTAARTCDPIIYEIKRKRFTANRVF